MYVRRAEAANRVCCRRQVEPAGWLRMCERNNTCHSAYGQAYSASCPPCLQYFAPARAAACCHAPMALPVRNASQVGSGNSVQCEQAVPRLKQRRHLVNCQALSTHPIQKFCYPPIILRTVDQSSTGPIYARMRGAVECRVPESVTAQNKSARAQRARSVQSRLRARYLHTAGRRFW